MTLEQLINTLKEPLKEKLSANIGLSSFAKKRSKFECWFKVEVVDCLVKAGFDAQPEVGNIDVVFDRVAIELKTANTNLPCEGVTKSTGKPITTNLASIIKDVYNLKAEDYEQRFVVFLLFPIPARHPNGPAYLQRVAMHLDELKEFSFVFANGVPGLLCFGSVAPLVLADLPDVKASIPLAMKA